MDGRFVTYYRVSTAGQGHSGLGLEAQRKAVEDWLDGGRHKTLGEFIEIESGKNADRPELAKAIAASRKHKATLVVAKLDRLARNVHFISGLIEAKVPFVAVDRPNAKPFELHIYAAMAEEEARAISARTKAALAAAKARGVKLGNPNPAASIAKATSQSKAKADAFKATVAPLIRDLHAGGRSLHAIAGELNQRGVRSARGAVWYAATVRNMLKEDAP